MKKIRVGILFGGNSREREVSFAGGRTVYDNLDKSFFEPIPLFVDSFGSVILLNWENVYKGSIRDFYPAAKFLPDLPHGFQIYSESLNAEEALLQNGIAAEGKNSEQFLQKLLSEEIGTPLEWGELSNHIDIAFLALHGTFGEDGSIQGMLEWFGIPYTGSGILPSALGINKYTQKKIQKSEGLFVNDFLHITYESWMESDTVEKHQYFQQCTDLFDGQFVVKPANQGSSLGVNILKDVEFEAFCDAIDLAFFKLTIDADEFNRYSLDEQIAKIKDLTDIRTGIGLPLNVNNEIIKQPQELLRLLQRSSGAIELQAEDSESTVLIESFVEGREFSCIVVEHHKNQPIALPPTEIKKKGELFDYRSKYLPGLSHKETPMKVNPETLRNIRKACVDLYQFLGFEVYARIDGFVNDKGDVFLNDPNTTSGMMPSSFFFHQAAEIGLDPRQFLTFIIRQSLKVRVLSHPRGRKFQAIKQQLDSLMSLSLDRDNTKRRIAVIMGGYSFERHISMESGRNIYEKLSSSEEFEPIPLFLTGDSNEYKLYSLPLAYMLKDNADDIRDKILHHDTDLMLEEIRYEASLLRNKYNPDGGHFTPEEIPLYRLKEEVEGAFIALHGRPGEDGTLQRDLADIDIYYNGSPSESSEVTIDKYKTNEFLKKKGFHVAQHTLLSKLDFVANPMQTAEAIIEQFGLPLIAKPADDGCSAAVRKIKSIEEFVSFGQLIFREENSINEELAKELGVQVTDEIPQKEYLLIEEFIQKGDAKHFLEITGGMLTHINEKGQIKYEIFEPSESLAETEILSLEEKFLAGEGQNLTPSRFSKDEHEQQRISREVRNTLQKVAKCLGVLGYCRIDAFVKIFEDGKVETHIIEVNSLPGMTPATCIYHQAAINQYNPLAFIRGILNFGKAYQDKLKHSA